MKVRLALAAAAVLVVGVLTAMPASAQYVGGQPPAAGPVAAPTVEVQDKAAPVKVQVGRVTRVGGFALTGADIAQMVLIAGGFLLVGGLLVRQARRRPAISPS
jgi:hypothetical protein